MKIPSTTIDLVRLLEELYPDVMELDPTIVGTPEYWKKVGIVELIQKIKYKSTNSSLEKV